MKKEEYAATYKYGNTTVNIVAPPPMTKEEEDRIINEFHQAGYEIWKSLSEEERLEISKQAEEG